MHVIIFLGDSFLWKRSKEITKKNFRIKKIFLFCLINTFYDTISRLTYISPFCKKKKGDKNYLQLNFNLPINVC